MSDVRARIADTLHDNGCHRDDAAELADALLLRPGIAVVELPEPHQQESGWADFGHAQIDSRAPGQLAYFPPVARWITTTEARFHALALLAAAAAAEQVVAP